ncbi:MAG TPA: DUF2239 family protein [Longimicrobium sp.]|nr:DUF2239 family protein [Longimicrobium sp.]
MTMNENSRRYTAFAGSGLLATGELADVARSVRAALRGGEQAPVLVFDDRTGRVVDIDVRDTAADAVPNQAGDSASADVGEGAARRGRGRPKLGVVAGEVTLLPRHWEWLKSQPGGASVAIRKLVDAARPKTESVDTARQARDATYRFMAAIAGDQPWYEEALRALYSNRKAEFESRIQAWPPDVRDHALSLATPAFQNGDAEAAGKEPER